MTKIKISTLKNQAAFDLANKVGKKNKGRFFILISHMPETKGADTIDFSSNSFMVENLKENRSLEPECTLVHEDSSLAATHKSSAEMGLERRIIYLGLKVSKKLGKAVVRNKIRRRIKHMFRFAARKLPLAMWESRVFVVIPKRGFETEAYSEVEKDLIWHVKKICGV